MELIERAGFLTSLQATFEKVERGEGHCILISGDAGIGKTALVRTFCQEKKNNYPVYQGYCDALFTPRPLAPVYDIVWQIREDIWNESESTVDRSLFFARVFQELANKEKTSIIVFEDIHWADEATLDFIKFLARRINRLPCLFLLTCRDEGVQSSHSLSNVFGQLSPDSFTRLQLPPLSREAVDEMARKKGYSGEDVFSISGGNPFYVNEILASYSPGVPDNIKDSVLAIYNMMGGTAKQIWEILSVLPTALEVNYLEKMEPTYAKALENCLAHKILISNGGKVFFKHELYRRTIEASLSPFVRAALNKRILDLFRESFEKNQEIERIVHHAKNANEYELVVKYAPMAAQQAAAVGAHTEASKLCLTAIEYYQGHDRDVLIQFYESYAYECYLTNQIREAVIYQGKALNLWKEKGDIERIGNAMRFLSRLWWFEGNRKQSESLGEQAIAVLDAQPLSRAKAMAYSNMSQLKMLSDQSDECIRWGEKAIAIAEELGDEETLSHALNNVGTARVRDPLSKQEGIGQLQKSLDVALKNSYHEHAGRAYVNLGSVYIEIKEYDLARKILEEGIQYCDERNLHSWKAYLLSLQARVKLEMGSWGEAYRIAGDLIKNEEQLMIVKIGAAMVVATVNMRTGNNDALPLLQQGKARAFETMEPLRIIPIVVSLLEYEWITGKTIMQKPEIDAAIAMMGKTGNVYENTRFAYWLCKARRQKVIPKEIYEGYYLYEQAAATKAADLWERLGCPYEQALALFETDDTGKRKALTIVQDLGANAVHERMKAEMRSSGIKSIPRGMRKSTRANPAMLTGRELDVLQLLKEGLQNKEIASGLFISPKTVDHHISAILFKLDVNSRTKAVKEAQRLGIIN